MWRRLAFPALPVQVWDVGRDVGRDAGTPSPLVLFLHGAGERGVDGASALRYGLPSVVAAARGEKMRVVVPQCPPEQRWSDRIDDLARLLDALGIEALAVTGFSMGGQGVWSFAARYPDRVTRLAPVAPRLPANIPVAELAQRLPHVPTWVIHGARDARIPIAESDAIVLALGALGRPPTYTRYPDLGHSPACERAYADARYRAWLASSK